MGELPDVEQELVGLVRRWVDEQVRPVAHALEHEGSYPAELIAGMARLGLFGLGVPEPWGEAPVSTACFALVTEELARGWMSLSGAIGGHSVVTRLLVQFGTPEQQERYLPPLATAEVRATMALTEPSGGSDLQAMRTVARPDGQGGYLLTGSKTWITNAAHAGLVAVLCRTDPAKRSGGQGMSILLVEPGPGMQVSPGLPKLGYRGVESCPLHFEQMPVPGSALLGGEPGQGFRQMMAGLELGRIQVAARAVGVARAAFEAALAYAQQREAFGQPIWRHESVGNYLADMATRIQAARLLTLDAAGALDRGGRADLEAGMAKLFASETCLAVTRDAMRVHGAAGYSTELDIERYYRDAPLMAIGEGTNEIQRMVIARQLVDRSRS